MMPLTQRSGSTVPLDITDQEFSLFCELLEDSIGLCLKTREKRLVANRLRARIHELGLSSYFEYYRRITEGAGNQQELAALVDALTTNKTDFFRHLSQLEHFRDVVVPELIVKLRCGAIDKVRVWSAGCSTGEEAYSLGILLMESVPFGLFQCFSIAATDVSSAALSAAEAGVYHQKRFSNVDPGVIERYFDPVDSDHYRIKDRVRRIVEYSRHNLNSPIWSVGMFDVVFCRNVLIYFQVDRVKKIISRFHRRLKPSGILYLGQTEAMPESLDIFHRLAPSSYRRKDIHVSVESNDSLPGI